MYSDYGFSDPGSIPGCEKPFRVFKKTFRGFSQREKPSG
jgi:hypothetical protein